MSCSCHAHVGNLCYRAASSEEGGRVCPILLRVCVCMATRDRGAVAVNHQIILGLPKKSWWVTRFCLTWCSGFISGIGLIIWLLLGICTAP